MQPRRNPLLLLPAAVLCLAAQAQAADLYVDAAALPGYQDGTSAYPFQTIQQGLDAALPGDVVLVRPGLYYGAVELADQVQLVSTDGPGTTIIDGMGASPGAVVAPSSAATNTTRAWIEGFTVRNPGGLDVIYATNRIRFFSLSYFDVHRCVLEGAGGGTGFKVLPSVLARMSRCELRGFRYAVDAIWDFVRLDNLTIHDCEAAFNLYRPYETTIRNTVVTDVQAVVRLWGSDGGATVGGSNDAFHAYGELGAPSEGLQYPLFTWTDLLFADPLFAAPETGDYTLQPGSPLVDAGVDVGLPYEGAAPDIGAYELGVTLGGAAEGLAESYAQTPLAAFTGPDEQRRDAMTKKVVAVIHELEKKPGTSSAQRLSGLHGARHKLIHDVWAKSDGHYGGQPANDWIETLEEQTRLKEKVDGLVALIDAEIAGLDG